MGKIVKDSNNSISQVIRFLGSQRFSLEQLTENFDFIFKILGFSLNNTDENILKETFKTLEYFIITFTHHTILYSELWIFNLALCINLEGNISSLAQSLLETQRIFQLLYKPEYSLTLKKLSKIVLKEINTSKLKDHFSKINVKSMKILGYYILLSGEYLKKIINDINQYFEKGFSSNSSEKVKIESLKSWKLCVQNWISTKSKLENSETRIKFIMTPIDRMLRHSNEDAVKFEAIETWSNLTRFLFFSSSKYFHSNFQSVIDSLFKLKNQKLWEKLYLFMKDELFNPKKLQRLPLEDFTFFLDFLLSQVQKNAEFVNNDIFLLIRVLQQLCKYINATLMDNVIYFFEKLIDSFPIEFFTKENWIEFLDGIVKTILTSTPNELFKIAFIQFFIEKWIEIPSIFEKNDSYKNIIEVIISCTPQNMMIEMESKWIVSKLNQVSHEKSILLWNIYVSNLPSSLEFKKFYGLYLYPLQLKHISSETEKNWKYFHINLNKNLPQLCTELSKFEENPNVLYPFKFICESIELIYPQAAFTEFIKFTRKLKERKFKNFNDCIFSLMKGLKVKSEKIIPIFANLSAILSSNLSIWSESLRALKRCSELNQKSFETIEKPLLISLTNQELKSETIKFITEMNQDVLTTNLLKIYKKLNKKRSLDEFEINQESKKLKESNETDLFEGIGTGCSQNPTPSISFSSPPKAKMIIEEKINSPSSMLLTPPRKISNIVTRSSIDDNEEIDHEYTISPMKTPTQMAKGILKTPSLKKSKSSKKVQFTHNLVEEGELFFRRLENSQENLSIQELLDVQKILCDSLLVITQGMKKKNEE
eukprot:gene4370-7726_t